LGSIGDFAEQLMAQERETPAIQEAVPGVGGQAPDISHIVVTPDVVSTLVESVTGVKVPVVEEPTPEIVETPSVTTQVISEEMAALSEIKTLLINLSSQITEMTSCGSIGVNMAGPKEEPKKKKKKTELEEKLAAIMAKRSN